MLDYQALSQDPDPILAQLQRRGVEKSVVETLVQVANERKSAIRRADELRHTLNQASAQVQEKARGGDFAAVQAAREALKGLKSDIKASEEAQASAEAALHTLLLTVPNPPHASVPDGSCESDNVVVATFGTPRALPFAAKAHWDLVEALGIVSFEQGAKLSGARFAVYRGAGARLERAIASLMLDMARQHGYTEVAPPLLVRREAMMNAGQYPKFEGESFETLDNELVLIPTSEVPLISMHRDDLFDQAQLPVRYCAFTPCFRREAGAAGRDTRGLIRQHQFYKVELVVLTTPEASWEEHEQLTGHAEAVLQRLELPYRKVALCAGDMGFAAAKTYDLEVWVPAEQTYREISSCSNCADFQARRASIRYRPTVEAGQKARPRLVHTLNGSGLAVGRTFVAIMENGQQQDGSIRLPKALVSYFGADTIKRGDL